MKTTHKTGGSGAVLSTPVSCHGMAMHHVDLQRALLDLERPCLEHRVSVCRDRQTALTDPQRVERGGLESAFPGLAGLFQRLRGLASVLVGCRHL